MHRLVIFRLDYRNVLYMGLPLETAQKIQPVWNAAACILMEASRLEYMIPMLWGLC